MTRAQRNISAEIVGYGGSGPEVIDRLLDRMTPGQHVPISDGWIRRFHRALDQDGTVYYGVYVLVDDREGRRRLARNRRNHGMPAAVTVSGAAFLTSPRTVQIHDFWHLADVDDKWHENQEARA